MERLSRLTVAAEVPERVRAVYALNTYDYDTRYGDGIRRGGWFSNLVIGSLQIPIFGAIGARLEDRKILRRIMGGGYANPKNLPEDLLTDFDTAAHEPGYRSASRRVLSEWRVSVTSQDAVSRSEGTGNIDLWRARLVAHF